MNCEEFSDNLDNWLDGDLENGQLKDFLAHLSSCRACNRQARFGHNLLRELRDLEAPQVPDGMAERLLEGARPERQPVLPLAISACLLVAVLGGFSLWFTSEGLPARSAPQQWVTLELATPREVTVSLSTASDISLAHFTLELPEGVELAGYPAQRKLQWVSSLAKGENRLTLPLIAHKVPRGELVLRVEHGDRDRTLKIGVSAQEKRVSVRTPDGSFIAKAV